MAGALEDFTSAVQGLEEAVGREHPELSHVVDLFRTARQLVGSAYTRGGASVVELEDITATLAQMTGAMTAAVDAAKNPVQREPGVKT